MVGSVSPGDRVTVKKVIAKCIIPQEKYEKSKRLFLNNARKVSFDSFLNWLKLGDGVGKYIKSDGEDDKLFLPQVQQTVRNSGDNVSLIVVPNAGEVPEKREYLIPS